MDKRTALPAIGAEGAGRVAKGKRAEPAAMAVEEALLGTHTEAALPAIMAEGAGRVAKGKRAEPAAMAVEEGALGVHTDDTKKYYIVQCYFDFKSGNQIAVRKGSRSGNDIFITVSNVVNYGKGAPLEILLKCDVVNSLGTLELKAVEIVRGHSQ
jgi:hypothetical protein